MRPPILSKPEITPHPESERSPTVKLPGTHPSASRRLIISGFIIFLVAFGVRLLAWQDNRFEALRVQSAVTDGYRHTARLLREGGVSSFFSSASPLADPNHLGHPPGYSILMALAYGFSSDTDGAVQLLQIASDSLSAVLVLLIACALLSTTAAQLAGLLVALAPQFTYNSTLLLPDSLSVLPILLMVYCLTRATRSPRLGWLILAGALVGVSCWLRANAMLLAPFVALAVPFLFERGRRLSGALVLCGGMLLVIAPLTIRNAIVHRHFIPVSLGAGQTLLEGIADYDTDGRFGIPATDMGIMKMEAELYGRPDYYGMLFNPDGIRRERLRLRRGFDVIRSHPIWFAGVMVRRAAGMLRLERVRRISPNPPVTHSLEVKGEVAPAWSSSPAELLADGTLNRAQAEISLNADGQMLSITGDLSRYENQFTSAPLMVRQNTDYLLQLPVRIEQGRMTINVVSPQHSTPYAFAILEPQDWKTTAEQPLNLIRIPFVSRADGPVHITFANAGSQALRPVVHIGRAEVYALGPTRYVWTSPLRALFGLVQKLFVSAVMLPLAVFGFISLVRERRLQTLALLLVVPAYYLCFQSMLHTEYRYVLAIHYFLFVLVAVGLETTLLFLWRRLLMPAARRLSHRLKQA